MGSTAEFVTNPVGQIGLAILGQRRIYIYNIRREPINVYLPLHSNCSHQVLVQDTTPKVLLLLAEPSSLTMKAL